MSSVIDQAIDNPSKVEVPLPTSSKSIKELLVARLRIWATSIISIMNVDLPLLRSSLAPTLVKTLSTSPTLAFDAGTNDPD